MRSNPLYKVIVVEDEALIRRSIVKKIEEINGSFWVIGEAMDGQEALALIEKEAPHLIITDIQMPVMNGLELAKNIYFAYPNIKVAIISGHHEFEYAREAIQYQVEEYLLKPVSSEALFNFFSKVELKLQKDLEALSSMANSISNNMSTEDLVQAVEIYIKENFTKNLTLSEIASQLNISVDYLGKIFKKYRNETPIKYIIRLRINEAKRLLSTQVDLEIGTIGEMVGYADPYYFSRIFKNQTGQYPSEYREDFLQSQ